MKLQQGATPPLLKYQFKPLKSGHGHEPQGGLRFCLSHTGCVKRLKCLKLTHRGPAYNCKHILPLSKLVGRSQESLGSHTKQRQTLLRYGKQDVPNQGQGVHILIKQIF